MASSLRDDIDVDVDGSAIAIADDDNDDDNEEAEAASTAPKLLQTNLLDIQNTIIHPPAVRINVQGAFIVDDDEAARTPRSASPDDYEHDTKDIRLPNHKSVVSHIAVDVGFFFFLFSFFFFLPL